METTPIPESMNVPVGTTQQSEVPVLQQGFQEQIMLTIPGDVHITAEASGTATSQIYNITQAIDGVPTQIDQLVPMMPIESELHQPQPAHTQAINPVLAPATVEFKPVAVASSEKTMTDMKNGSATPSIQLPNTVLTTEEFNNYLVQQTNRDIIKAAELVPEDALEQQKSASEFVQSLIAQGLPETTPSHPIVTTESIRAKRKNDNKKCTCHNTQCLKRYCVCFNSGRMCSPECSCTNCRNREGFEVEIQQAINRVKETRAPYAPPPKDPNVVITPSSIGCRCKKECRKNYCDCRRSNHCCSKLCTCENCCNDKYMGELPEVTEAMKREERMMRKKNRAPVEHSASQNINDYQMIGDYGSDYTPQIQQFGVEFQSQFTGM